MPYSGAGSALHLAVLRLVGDDPIRERLLAAYTTALKALSPRDLPPALRVEFVKITEPLSRCPGPDQEEDDVRGTLERMDDWETARIAERIFDLYARLIMENARIGDSF